MGKVATSPLPSRGSPPLQSGGQNQKWPTYGQKGYVTPAVSGIPTASERGEIKSGPQVGKVATSPLPSRGSPPLHSGGGKSEVAHKWAKWLRHPCRLGDPHRFRAGGGNQKSPTSGQSGYVTPAVSGIPTASERGREIRSGPQVGKVATSPLPSRGSPPLQSGGGGGAEVAHKWAKWLRHPCRLGDPQRSRAGGGGGSEVAHKWAKWLRHPCRLGDPHRFRAGGKIRSGLQVGKVATSPLPSRGSPPLQSGGGKSEVVPQVGKVATSPLPSRGSPPLQSGEQIKKRPTYGQSGYATPAVSGIPTASERGGGIRSGPQVGKVATAPLPSRGSPPLHSGRQNQKWPTSGQSGYVTPAVSGIPTASERGREIRSGPQVGKVATSPLPSRGSPPLQSGGGGLRSGPQVGKVATSPLPSRGSPLLQSRGGTQKWPTSGQSGYVTPAVSGIPTASERGGGVRSGPQVGKRATSPLPSRGSPPLQTGGQNQKWRTYGQSGYVTLAVSGIPTASERGREIRSGPQVGKVATSPLPSRGSPPLQSGGQNQKWPTYGQSGYVTPAVSGIPTASEQGGEIRSGPQVGKVATSPLPSRGSPPLQTGGQNQKWPTCGQSRYVTPAVSGIPTASERGGKSEVAHKWAKWLRHPCRLGDPHRFTAGGGNQKWPTSGQSGYVTPAVSGIPTASQRGGGIRSGPQVGKVATSPLPSRGSPPLQSWGGEIRSGPQVGKVATSPLPSRGSPPLQSGGGEAEVAHKWAKWLRHPCRLGDPHRFRAGGGSRSGPQVGKVATSPLPSRGSPPLQSGGKQKWPTVGKVATSPLPSRGSPPLHSGGGGIRSGPQVGKVATSPLPSRGSPALQSGGGGGEAEVAHKWAKWLRHPCRLGDPHRFRAGGKIRSGPLVGKVAFFY